jgi:hypothetical protein
VIARLQSCFSLIGLARGGGVGELADGASTRFLAGEHNPVRTQRSPTANHSAMSTNNTNHASLEAHADKKRPPLSAGAKLPWFSRVESFFGGHTARGRRSGNALGEGCSTITAAPHPSKKLRPGTAQLPGPPNCFPSTGYARCWSLRALACRLDPDWLRQRLTRFRGPLHAYGRRECRDR